MRYMMSSWKKHNIDERSFNDNYSCESCHAQLDDINQYA